MDKWLSMGIDGTFLLLAVICFRHFFSGQIPRRFFVFLWICVIARLLLPVSIPVPQPAGSCQMLSVLSEKLQTNADISCHNPASAYPAGTISQGDLSSAGAFDSAAMQSTVFLCTLWLPIALLLAAHILSRHIHSLRIYRMSLPVSGQTAEDWLRRRQTIRKAALRKSEFIKSPLTYGLIHPVILLPSAIRLHKEELLCILEHEWTHIRRWDILVKYLLYLTICIYWFHPLVWLMASLLNRDIELACDEETIRRFPDRCKKTYVLTLIRLAENCQSSVFPMNTCFSGHSEIEERIRFIMKTKKYSHKTTVLAIGMLLCTITTFTVSAQDTSKEATEIKTEITTDAAIEATTDPAAEPAEPVPAPSDTGTPKAAAPITAGTERPIGNETCEKKPPVTSKQIVTLARQYLGAPYQCKGTDLFTGIGNAEFVTAIYAMAGIDLPADPDTLTASGYEIPLTELRAGDIVFYPATQAPDIRYYVAIYNGDGRVIHAKNMRKGVTLSDLSYREIGGAIRILE